MTSTLFQHGTLGMLMEGFLEGTITINEILKKGNYGLGTLSGADGEVVIVDGKAFHMNGDKRFIELNGDEMTPFGMVTQFSSDNSFKVEIKTSEAVLKEVKSHMVSKNLFSAVKITGTFKMMHIRTIHAQEEPYQRLIESAREQVEIKEENITGTLIGFYTPELFHGVSVGGFHNHFVDDSEKVGGHVLDFEVLDGTVEVQNFETFEQQLPLTNEAFNKSEMDNEKIRKEIRETE